MDLVLSLIHIQICVRDRLMAALPDMGTEMRRLANGTIAKLEQMTDDDFDGQRFDFPCPCPAGRPSAVPSSGDVYKRQAYRLHSNSRPRVLPEAASSSVTFKQRISNGIKMYSMVANG